MIQKTNKQTNKQANKQASSSRNYARKRNARDYTGYPGGTPALFPRSKTAKQTFRVRAYDCYFLLVLSRKTVPDEVLPPARHNAKPKKIKITIIDTAAS